MNIELVPIDASGSLSAPLASLPDFVAENCRATADFYKAVGFEPPWIGYVAVSEGRAVGGGAFKGPPQDHRVEIAYYTVPELEGRGVATAIARELVRVAQLAAPDILITAQTLSQVNASNTLLKKLGFTFHAAVQHPDDGEVWEWHLRAFAPANDLEKALIAAQHGRMPMLEFMDALIRSNVVVLVDREPTQGEATPMALTNQAGEPVLAVFTAAQRCGEWTRREPQFGVVLHTEFRSLLQGMAPGVGLVVNPGLKEGLEMPAAGVAQLQARARRQ
jgi:[ribosomal protein S5]-alanine N-acetyltransferase